MAEVGGREHVRGRELACAPGIGLQPPPLSPQRCHEYSNVCGAPVHEPGAAVSVCPSAIDPLTVGSAVLFGVQAPALSTMLTIVWPSGIVALAGALRLSLKVSTCLDVDAVEQLDAHDLRRLARRERERRAGGRLT